MIAEIILIPEGMGLDAAKASARYVARGLSSIGMKVREHISVCPDESQFRQAVSTALTRSNILVTVGGLGRQSNFMAKTILSRGLGLPLEENADALDGIHNYCRRTGEPFEAGDVALAMLPRGAAAFCGSYSKLPGCAISSAKQHIILLPEVQAEIAPMFNKYVSPYLGGASTTTVMHTIRTYGVSESVVCDALGDILNIGNPAVTVQKDESEVLVRVAAHAATAPQAAALCTPTLQNIVDCLGDAAYGLDVDSMQAAVIGKLEKKELDIAIADGGAGGMLTRVISETPDGQNILRYTVAADTPEAKEKKLGLNRKLLKKQGNVSEYAAVAAADAAREKGGAALGVSILANTGGEKSRTCPKGTVYIAVCDADHVFVKKLVVGDGNAEADVIIDATISRALNMIRLVTDYYPRPYPAAIPVEEALDGRSVTGLDEYEEDVGDEPEEKTPFIKRFIENFIIRKTDKRGVKVRKFIFMLSLLIFMGTAGYVGNYFYSGWVAQKQADELKNMFTFGEMGDVTVSPDYPKSYSLKFAGLWNINSDVKGFLSIADTNVNYPIVQAADNDYYLRRNFYGKSSQYGIPFLDHRVDMKTPSDNIVIYGHNMKDGQIFGELISYSKLDYYKAHPVIDFTTIYDENQYKILSVFITNAYENQGPVFAYHDFIDAENNAALQSFITEVKRRSIINTTVDAQKGDKLLTLSTCTYEFKDARLVIVARAVRRGESAEVDTAGAALNPSPLYPDVWYSVFGGTKPVFDDANAVPGLVAEQDADTAAEEAAEEAASRAAEEAASKAAAEAESKAAAEAASKAAAEASKKAAEEAASKALEEAASKAAAEVASKAAAEAASKAAEEAARQAQLEEEAAQQEEDDDEGYFFDEDDGTLAKTQYLAAAEASEEKPAATKKTTTTTKKSAARNATVNVNAGGKIYKNADVLEILTRVVQNEIGSTFEHEAIKAQAVAAYTFIKEANSRGATPYVALASSVSDPVYNAVCEVLGQAVYYDGDYAFTPYHATSSGYTTSSEHVWGGYYPYLVSVESKVDTKAPNYRVRVTMSRSKVANLLSQKLGIKATGNPANWFEILERTDGGYNGAMSVCGETHSLKTGNTLTGRLLRESVLSLRSSRFDVKYNKAADTFTFTTYGYGHGVGMSQNGANLYAKQGWDYIEILEHYYPGTEVW